MASKTTYNSAPLGILELGATYMTEMAQALQQLQNDPLAELLPDRQVPTKRVEVQVKDGSLRVTGIVTPGQPNGLNKWDSYREFSYTPALFRRGGFVDQETLNYLSSADKGEKAYGMNLVQEAVQTLVEQGNMVDTVMRVQLLTGGINLTDHETGNTVEAASGIPATNYVTLGTGGTTGFNQAGDVWSNQDADIIDQLIRLRRRAKLVSLAEPDVLIMNGGVHELLLRNKKIRGILEGNGAGDVFGFIRLEAGKIVEMAGMRVVICDTLYDVDNADGTLTRKFVLPINKVVMLTSKHPMMPSQKLGYTVLAKGENRTGAMGPWVDSGESRGPQQAPGVWFQYGKSSLPVLYFPKWVHNIVIDSAQNITNIVGAAYA